MLKRPPLVTERGSFAARDQFALTASPPERVPIPLQTVVEMEFWINLTDPSPIPQLTPPVCRLRAELFELAPPPTPVQGM